MHYLYIFIVSLMLKKLFAAINIHVIFGYFCRKFRVVSVFSVCFGLLRNSSVCFGCFDKGSKHRNKPKLFVFGFTKQTETNAKQILFRFVSVRTEIYFWLFRGHPTCTAWIALKEWDSFLLLNSIFRGFSILSTKISFAL